jgi:hypothetical protein
VLNFPLNPRPKNMTVAIVYSSLINTASSGVRQGCMTGPSRAMFTLDYNDSRDDELRPLFAFLNRLQGGLLTFDVVLPYISHGSGFNGVGAVTATVGTGYVVNTKSWPANTLIRKESDVVQFSGSPRIYVLAADMLSDSNGFADAVICSPLVVPAVANEVVSIKDIKIRARIPKDKVSMGMAAGELRSMKSITIEEEIYA